MLPNWKATNAYLVDKKTKNDNFIIGVQVVG